MERDWERGGEAPTVASEEVQVRVRPYAGTRPVTSYVAGGGRLPEDWRARARQLDLLNLVGFLDMAEERPTVFKDCLRMIDQTVRV